MAVTSLYEDFAFTNGMFVKGNGQPATTGSLVESPHGTHYVDQLNASKMILGEKQLQPRIVVALR